MKAAGWATGWEAKCATPNNRVGEFESWYPYDLLSMRFEGFSGGRDVALSQLRACWEEGGIQAAVRGAVADKLKRLQESPG